jgi:hypothetical protein
VFVIMIESLKNVNPIYGTKKYDQIIYHKIFNAIFSRFQNKTITRAAIKALINVLD